MYNDDFDTVESSEDILADMFSEFLLLDLIQKKKAEIYENVVFEGKRRYYIEDLSQRDYTLENTTPYQLSINGHIIVATAWGKMLTDTVNYLLDQHPMDIDSLLSFRTEWTKSVMFATSPKTNHKILNNGLYLNCNHTALHACWLLQDILHLFEVDMNVVSFLIHRPCSAEPSNVKDYIETRFKKGMTEFLINDQRLSESNADSIISIIVKYLNPMLKTISKSYDNFFLFDDAATLYNYVKKVRDKIDAHPTLKVEAKKVFHVSLDYLVKYFKSSTY